MRRVVEAPKKLPCPAACASLWRLPGLLAMTHMRLSHGSRGHHEHRLHSVWSMASVGGELGPSDACSNKDAGKHERETPTPCENEQAQNSKKKTRIQELTPAPHNTQYTAQPITTTHLTEATTNKETLCFGVRSFLLFTVGTKH